MIGFCAQWRGVLVQYIPLSSGCLQRQDHPGIEAVFVVGSM
jgi:hypothetical protein